MAIYEKMINEAVGATKAVMGVIKEKRGGTFKVTDAKPYEVSGLPLHDPIDLIEAHICIAFTAYCIYKDLERILYREKSTISIQKAAELTHNMYEINYKIMVCVLINAPGASSNIAG